MKEQDFNKIIKKNKYQVFLFCTRLPIPLSFSVHTWLVTNNKGKIMRWEVWESKKLVKESYGYLYYKLFNNPIIGIKIFPSDKEGVKRWDSKMVGFIGGDKNSLAFKMVKFIENDCRKYPYINKYNLYPGPNSNTFIQWVVDKFPESGLKLPWNAFGKSYVKKLIS